MCWMEVSFDLACLGAIDFEVMDLTTVFPLFLKLNTGPSQPPPRPLQE